MSRPKTPEEIREEFLDMIRAYVRYWDEAPKETCREKLDGLAFSILNIFDGTTIGLPAFDIVCNPHPEDEEYHKAVGEDWYTAAKINDCCLHEFYYK